MATASMPAAAPGPASCRSAASSALKTSRLRLPEQRLVHLREREGEQTGEQSDGRGNAARRQPGREATELEGHAGRAVRAEVQHRLGELGPVVRAGRCPGRPPGPGTVRRRPGPPAWAARRGPCGRRRARRPSLTATVMRSQRQARKWSSCSSSPPCSSAVTRLTRPPGLPEAWASQAEMASRSIPSRAAASWQAAQKQARSAEGSRVGLGQRILSRKTPCQGWRAAASSRRASAASSAAVRTGQSKANSPMPPGASMGMPVQPRARSAPGCSGHRR